ncbi:SpoVR family protein [compost metagenome]
MSATAERISRYELLYGASTVEAFIDAVLAVQEHVDPQLIRPHRYDKRRQTEEKLRLAKERGRKPVRQSHYEDLWSLDVENNPASRLNDTPAVFPPEPEKDIVWFIQEYSESLEDWQRDIMSMLREEMLYFWPQMETKIMNEGWASYWHQRMIRELDLTSDETIEFAKLNASVVQPSRQSLNPYYLGLKIFEDIERRWEKPTEEERNRYGRTPGQGREKIFEVRELDSDTSFIRSYLTKDLVRDLDLYVFEKQGSEWLITDKAWENIRDQLVASRVNGGSPYIVVHNADYQRAGELMLKHQYEGIELDLKYLERTLPYVYQLWGKTVHIETVVEEKAAIFTYDGQKHYRKIVG